MYGMECTVRIAFLMVRYILRWDFHIFCFCVGGSYLVVGLYVIADEGFVCRGMLPRCMYLVC